MTERQRFLLLDSCVVLDFLKADDRLFSLISRFVGEVYIADELFVEIRNHFNVVTPEELGLRMVRVEFEDVVEAQIRSEGSRLSDKDYICLLTARRQRWTCVTNDRRLCNECERENVDYMRGLRLLVELFRVGGIDYDAARDVARSIRETNPWLKDDVLERFYTMLDEI